MTTYYINNLVTGTYGGVFYYAGGQRVDIAAPTYTLVNHLGSTRYTLTQSGAKTAEMRYYPWGSTHYSSNPAGTPRRQYTGQINDGDTGLYYYNARYYEPGLARFVQADTIVPDPTNPQSFNRYAYALNSPVVHNDPTGHCIDGITTAACIVGGILLTAMIVDYGWTVYDMLQYQAIIDDPNATPEEKEEARVMMLVAGGAEMIEPDVGVQLPLDDLARHGIIAIGQEAAQEGAEAAIKWSSGAVRKAAEVLEMGARAVRVNTRAEAEELFLGLFQGRGLTNTTGMSKMEVQDLLGTTSGTYHWDDVLDSKGNLMWHDVSNPHGMYRHLQIHLPDGTIIRIDFGDPIPPPLP